MNAEGKDFILGEFEVYHMDGKWYLSNPDSDLDQPVVEVIAGLAQQAMNTMKLLHGEHTKEQEQKAIEILISGIVNGSLNYLEKERKEASKESEKWQSAAQRFASESGYENSDYLEPDEDEE